MASTPTATDESVPVFRKRVLIADTSRMKFKDVIASLESSNVEVNFVTTRNEILAASAKFKPDIVLLNLFMDNASTLGTIRDLRKEHEKQGTKILVLTAHYSKENIAECVRAGATDFILEPFDPRLLIQRVRYQLQEREFIAPDDLRAEPTQVQTGFQMVYEALKILTEVRDNNRAIFEVLKRVAELSGSTRVNCFMGDIETNTGTIIAASDDIKLQNMAVDLEKYPEVREVMLNGSVVFVKDITQNPLTKEIKDKVKTIDITSLLVFPIRHRQETIGTLNIRLGKSGMEVSDKHLKTFYMIALSIASKVAARKLLKKLEPSGTPPPAAPPA